MKIWVDTWKLQESKKVPVLSSSRMFLTWGPSGQALDVLVSLQTLLKIGHLNRLTSLCIYFHRPLDQIPVSSMILTLESVIRNGCHSRAAATWHAAHTSGNSMVILMEVFTCNFERDLLRVLKSIQVHSCAVIRRPVTCFAIRVSLQWWYCALLDVQRRDLILGEKTARPWEQRSTGPTLRSA